MNLSVSRCRVKGCRFPTAHTTWMHMCGTCGSFGHGQLECGDASAIRRLDGGNRWECCVQRRTCDVTDCRCPWTHTRASHHDRDDAEPELTEDQNIVRRCPQCRTISSVDTRVEIYTNAECIVCFDNVPKVVFRECRHAIVCAACARRCVRV